MRSERTVNYTPLIIILSVLVPALVAMLYFVSIPAPDLGFDIRIFPKVNAFMNTITTILLISGYFFIRNRQIQLHKYTMISAIICSAIFLLSYVSYHSMAESTKFRGEGAIRSIYYFILLTHIVLAALILPLILITFTRGLTGNFAKHKKIARYALPLWLYVTITGVLVYLMISPYY